MKSVISILLSVIMICLCLTGCHDLNADEQTGPTDITGDCFSDSEVTEQSDSTDTTEKLFFELKDLPDIGKSEDGTVFNYFYEDGLRDEFEPSDEYGKIIPYVASTKAYESEYEEYGTLNFHKLGFLTAEGKVITSGIYDEVFEKSTDAGKSFFICQRYTDGDEFNCKLDIISDDGSWIIKTDAGAYCRIFNETREMSFIMTFEKKEVSLYDFNGKRFFNTKLKGKLGKYDVDVPFVNDEKVIIEEGVKNVCYNLKGEKLYDVDLDGERILKSLGDKLITDEERILDLEGNQLLKGEYDRLVCDNANNCLLLLKYSDKDDSKIVERYSENLELIDYYEIDGWDYDFLTNGKESAFVNYDKPELYSAVNGEPFEREFYVYDIYLNGFQVYYDNQGCYYITEDAVYVYKLNGELLFKLDDAYIVETEDWDGNPKAQILSEWDGNYFVYLSNDGFIKIIELETGEEKRIAVKQNADYLNLYEGFIEVSYSGSDENFENHLYSIKTLDEVDPWGYHMCFGEYTVCSDLSNSYVLNPDNEVILKINNSGMY